MAFGSSRRDSYSSSNDMGGLGGGGPQSGATSTMERSSADFIVPGEMELKSAVKSVSKCNGSALPASNTAESTITVEKMDQNGQDNNSKQQQQILAPAGTTFPHPTSCYNNGLNSSWQNQFQYQQPNAPTGGGGGGYLQPQWNFRPLAPPNYRNPPAVTSSATPASAAVGLKPHLPPQLPPAPPRCPCCGESNWQHFQFVSSVPGKCALQ